MSRPGRGPHPRPDPLPGDRVVARYLLPTGTATDVIGTLTSAGDPLIIEADGGPRAVARATVVALKAIPPRPIRNREIRALTRAQARSRPSLESTEIDGWLCRFGSGVPGARANSAAPLNPDAARGDLTRVRAWYAERDLPVRLLWVERIAGRPGAVGRPRLAVFTCPTADLAAESGRVQWAPAPSAPWRGLQSGPAVDAGWSAAVLGEAWFAVLDDGAGPAAAVRLSLTRDGDDPAGGTLWAGIGSLVVAPDRRRTGLGAELVRALAARARDLGAQRCYLEVREDNAAGHALYSRLGFTEHHRYDYWTETASAATPDSLRPPPAGTAETAR